MVGLAVPGGSVKSSTSTNVSSVLETNSVESVLTDPAASDETVSGAAVVSADT